MDSARLPIERIAKRLQIYKLVLTRRVTSSGRKVLAINTHLLFYGPYRRDRLIHKQASKA